MKYIPFIAFVFFVNCIVAQFPKFQLGGLSRALFDVSELSPTDTINKDVNQELNIVFDLAMNAQLNKKINFYSELRLGSSLEVFDTSASYIKVRRILLFGDITKNLSFEVGDIDVKMTQFTLWNNNEEGAINENELFSAYREIQRYENFNEGNYWRRQGAKLYGKNKLFSADSLSYQFFISREQASNEISIPDRFLYGESIHYERPKFSFGINHVDLFTFNKGIVGDTNLHNHVYTLNSSVKINKLMAKIELGQSSRTMTQSENDLWINGQFLHLNLNYPILKNWSIELGYRSVSDDFSSPGAQTKRINYTQAANLFSTVNNSASQRELLLADVISDITLFRQNSIYNRTIDYDLDAYNPLFGLSEPYGVSTPNRQGFDLNTVFKDSMERINCFASTSLLTDLTGEGIDQRKSFFQYKIGASLAIHKLIGWKKELVLKLGFKGEQVSRKHPDELFVDDVDVSSTLLDAGFKVEIFKGFKLLAAYKRLAVKGKDYLAVRDGDFTITSFNLFDANHIQQIASAGIMYSFNEKTSFMVNYQLVTFENLMTTSSFDFNQIFALIQLKF